MRSILKRRPSAATAIAIVALVLAGTGTATAALVITGANIKDRTVAGRDLKNHTIGAKKLRKRVIATMSGQKGERGPAGQAGPAGPAGAAGPAGPSAAYVDNLPGTITDQFTRILEVDVEPGSYTAQVNLEVHPAGATGQLECRFRALGGTPTLLGHSGVLFLGDVPASGNIDARFISYGGGFTAADGGTVEMVCKHSGGAVETLDGDLVVTRVGKLTAG
jgi:hypothetical protein